MASSIHSFFIPENALFLKRHLNRVANFSESPRFIDKISARILALSTPIFSAFQAPIALSLSLVGPLHHILEGELRQAGVKFLSELTHTAQLLAFTIASTAWALLSMVSSRPLTYWRSQLLEPVDLQKLLETAISDQQALIQHIVSSDLERENLIEQLIQGSQQVKALQSQVQELLKQKAELEHELFMQFDLVELPEDLSRSTQLASPYEQFDAFDKLSPQLLGIGPLFPIFEMKNRELTMRSQTTNRLDTFTSSLLTYFLLKARQRLDGEKISKVEFEQIVTKIREIVENAQPSNDLEFEVLKYTIDSAELKRTETPYDFNPELSIKPFIELILNPTLGSKALFHPYLKGEIAISILSEMFGGEFVNEIVGYYSLTDSGYWNQRDLALVVIGIAANLDLQSIKLWSKSDNEEVIQENAFKLRQAALSFTKIFAVQPAAHQQKQFAKDIALLDAVTKIAVANTSSSPSYSNHARNAAAEHAARDIGYSLFDRKFTNFYLTGEGDTKFKEGMILSVAGLKGNEERRLYTIHSLHKGSGLYGVVLVPVTVQEDDEGIVIFRGTFDLASVLRDISPTERRSWDLGIEGPGAASFEAARLQILEKWKQIQEEKQLKKWLATGHSLGGSDAARFMAALLSDPQKLGTGCTQMTLMTFNAPGVESYTRDLFIKGVGVYPKCQFAVKHLEGAGDPVPLAGSCRIADTNAPIANLEVSQTIFAQPNAANAKGVHSTRWFTRDPGADPTVLRRILFHNHNAGE